MEGVMSNILKTILLSLIMLLFLGFYFFKAVQAADLTKGLIIVTTENIRLNSEKLGELVTGKEKMGFTVKIATEKDFGGDNLKGYEKAKLIRSWLKENSSGYSFLLLIGDPNTKMGDIPMVIAMPKGPDASDPCIDTGYPCNRIPTDYYYSDLSGEFDLNDDGVAGQAPMDLEAGGVDFNAEIYTGRIPVYFGEIEELDQTLSHIISYMNMKETEIAYRRKMLFPMSFIWFDGFKVFQTMHENKETAETSEWFIHNVLKDHSDISYTRLYEAEGFYPSRYEFERPLNNENIVDEWKKGYGMIFWGGHGFPTTVARTVWLDDANGNGLGENEEVESYEMIKPSDAQEIASGKPGFIVAISCLVGNVDAPGSITHRFLADGAAVGIISSTSVTDPSRTKWTDLESELDYSTVSEDTVGVVFFEELIKGGYAGKIFYDYMAEFGQNPAGRVLDHKYMLNYYGDPTLTLYDTAVDDIPDEEISDEEKNDTELETTDDVESSSSGCSMVAVDETDKSLIIVTTEFIKNTSKKLSEFIQEKESRGFKVLVGTEKDYGGEGVKGAEKAFMIREWLVPLKNNYKYLLLIGDPNPKYGDMPMLSAYTQGPDGGDYASMDLLYIPTDQIYRNLDGAGDCNDNGFFYEFAGDGGYDCANFEDTFVTGRIPVYFDDTDELDEILDHSLKYMNQREEQTAYRQKLLFPMAFVWFDGYNNFGNVKKENREIADVSEWLIANILPDFKEVTFTRMYETEGHFATKYKTDIPLTNENLINEWEKNGYGIIFWGGHGQSNSVSRTIWADDKNGNELAENSEVISKTLIQTGDFKGFSGDEPGFVIAFSCLVGDVTVPGNISHDMLLKGAAVGVISSTFVDSPSYNTKFEDFESDLSDQDYTLDLIGIHTIDKMLQGSAPAEVLANLRNEIGKDPGVRVFEHKIMMHYYGDPTLTLYDTAVDDIPDEEVSDETLNDTGMETADDVSENSGGCSMVFN